MNSKKMFHTVRMIFFFLFILGLQVNLVKAQTDSELPIDLVADSGEFNPKEGTATYSGNVKVTQGASTIWADKLVIYLDGTKAKKIEATGSPAKFEYLGKKLPIKGQAQKAVYLVPSKIVTLTGKAKITQGSDLVTGSKLTYNLSKEQIKGSKIRMKFLPKTK